MPSQDEPCPDLTRRPWDDLGYPGTLAALKRDMEEATAQILEECARETGPTKYEPRFADFNPSYLRTAAKVVQVLEVGASIAPVVVGAIGLVSAACTSVAAESTRACDCRPPTPSELGQMLSNWGHHGRY